jgi:hypothetical protein
MSVDAMSAYCTTWDRGIYSAPLPSSSIPTKPLARVLFNRIKQTPTLSWQSVVYIRVDRTTFFRRQVMHARLKLLIVAASLLTICGVAQAGELGIGMKAPTLEVAKWFKGTPAKLGDGKTINVIEFWATW